MRGFGAMLSFEIVGDADAAEAVCNALRVVVHATSLGGVESLIERRARWAGDAEVVSPTLLRLSVGIEHVEDLWDDLRQGLDGALERVPAARAVASA
jgi:cystathionine gamma-synthase